MPWVKERTPSSLRVESWKGKEHSKEFGSGEGERRKKNRKRRERSQVSGRKKLIRNKSKQYVHIEIC